MNTQLDGRTALVTGSTGGIGVGIARAVAAAGAQVDVLVNNAAQLIEPAVTPEVPASLIASALAVNVAAPFLFTGVLVPAMVERGWGAVVNIGSINGVVGMARSALYSATKAALHSLTLSWSAEFAAAGVRVNPVAPGPTATSLNLEREQLLAPIMARIPSGRMSTVDDIGAAVVFLASDPARNIHGATLSVDGGYTAV